MASSNSLTGQDLSNADLRNSDVLIDQVLFGTNLSGANLYGARISLQCDSFDGVTLDDINVAKLLLMIALADIDERWVKALHATVKSMVGEERYSALCRYLKLA